MAYTELHTAAIRFVHVSRPTDRDLDYLEREFHLTPDDTEAVFGVAADSTIINQPTYRHLTVQWPLPTRRGVELTDVHCFVGRSWVVVIDYGNFPAATDLVNELRSVPSERLWQDGPMMVLYEVWRRAVRSMNALDQAVDPQHFTALTRARWQAGEKLKEFAAGDPAIASDAVTFQSFQFLAFTLGHANPAGARMPVVALTRLPLTARGYAAVSAAVVLVTLLVVSQTL